MKQDIKLEKGDVVVVAQSVVSKSEGNVVELSSVSPNPRAEEIAENLEVDPRKIQVILDETEEIIRLEHVLISETKHGFICANAGVDGSNVGTGKVTTLPDQPDKSAKRISQRLEKEFGKKIGVIISDSWGRPFRLGAVGFAIGIAGLKPLINLKGKKDAYGRELTSTTR